MDKEDIITRRRFFKKSVNLLPIFALALKGLFPIKTVAKQIMDCNNQCSYSCSGGCNNTCNKMCGDSCGGSCHISCKTSCGRNCV